MKFPRNHVLQSDRRAFFSPARQGSRRLGPTPAFSPRQLLRYTQAAMACQFEVMIPATSRGSWTWVERSFAEIHRLETQLTVFSDSSDVALLNRRAETAPVGVEPGLLELLKLSRDLSYQTRGAFDPTSAPLSRCWGFFSRNGRPPEAEELNQVLNRVGCGFLEIDEAAGTVRFHRSLELNFGAIGKGYALDRAASILRRHVDNYLMHAGHSTVLAEASGSSWMKRGWRIGLRNPFQHEHNMGEVLLRKGALSTSGAAEQKFSVDEREYGHIIDPRTGYPADSNASATALAPTAAVADALSTAFYLMTLEEIEDFCGDNPAVGAVIVLSNQGPDADVHCFGCHRTSWEVSF